MTEEYLSLINVGTARYEGGDAASAVASFQTALKLFPTEPAARLNLARAMVRNGDFTNALFNAEFVLERDRHNTAARYLAGLALLKNGEPSLAAAQFEAAARQDPSNDTVHFQLALALKDSDRTLRSIEELNIVVSLNTNASTAYYRLALESMAAGNPDRAEEYMNRFRVTSTDVTPQENTLEALEQTVYTRIEIPDSVFQPDAEGIPVSFSPNEVMGSSDQNRPPFTELSIGDSSPPRLVANHSARGVIPLNARPKNIQISVQSPGESIGFKGHVTSRSADMDNDGLMDTMLFSTNTFGLLRQQSTNVFELIRTRTGITSSGATDAVWVDYDHDGDVDLFVGEPDGRLVLWQNNGNRTFSDESELADIPVLKTPVAQLTVTDYDGDEAIDVVVSESAGATWLLRNDGLGIFEKQTLDWPAGNRHAVEDFDNDLKRDILIANGNVIHGSLTGGNGFQLNVPTGGIKGLRTIDFDNDGWLDLLVVVAKEQTWSLQLFRNRGAEEWLNVTETAGLAGVRMGGPGFSVEDFDSDGDTDLLVNNAAGDLTLLSNQGGNANRQLKLFLTGTKSNRSGIGTLVEIRTGGMRMSRMVSELPVEIGIARIEEIDSLRTIWPNGIVKNDVWVDTEAPLKIDEPFVSAGSCPYLYVWNGEEFEFITDVLGNAPIGLSMNRGQYIPADTSEYLWLGDDRRVVARDGKFLAQITDELREILYLDHTHMIAVDHAPGTEVHTTDKLEPPPFRDPELLLLKNRKKMIRSFDSTGADVTALLASIDGERTRPPRLRKPQLRGLALPYSYTIEFENFDPSQPLVLALTGWLMWGDASVNVAGGQNTSLANPFPRVEAEVNGEWRLIDVVAGAPSGKTKTILIDLSGKLPEGTSRLRWSSGLEIYWDRIALFEKGEPVEMVQRRLDVAAAELSWRGFGKQIRPTPTSPIVPDTTALSPYAPWLTTLSGNCTRYGDVTPLLDVVDDRYAILNGGDSVVMKFEDTLPAKPESSRRTFFLFCDGWDKDSDYNVKFGDVVEPLPFHGMDAQKYGAEPWKPDTAWVHEYNTRRVNSK